MCLPARRRHTSNPTCAISFQSHVLEVQQLQARDAAPFDFSRVYPVLLIKENLSKFAGDV